MRLGEKFFLNLNKETSCEYQSQVLDPAYVTRDTVRRSSLTTDIGAFKTLLSITV